jgi:hypothetical protein
MNLHKTASCDRVNPRTLERCDEPATHIAHDGRAVLLCADHAFDASERGVRVVAIPQPIRMTVAAIGGAR